MVVTRLRDLTLFSFQFVIKASLWLAFLFWSFFASVVMAEAEVVIHSSSQQQNPNVPHEVKLPGEEQSDEHSKKSAKTPSDHKSQFQENFFTTLKPIQRMQDVSADATCLEVMGEADLSLGNVAFVRQMAIRDALEAASLYRNTSVTSKQKVEAFQLKQAQTHFTSHSRIVGFSILREGKDLLKPKQPYKPCQFCDDSEKKPPEPKTYQVVLKVCLTDGEQGCPSLPVNFYQVPVVVAQPLVQYPEQARDLKNLAHGVQSEIVRRLKQAGYLNARPLNHASGMQVGRLIQPNLDPDLLNELRATTQAQLMLLSVIRSTALVSDPDTLINGIKQFYNFDAEPSQRHLEVDYFWVDLYRQKIVAQQRLGFDVKGEVVVGRDKPVGSSAFFATDTGKVFHLLLDQMVAQLQSFLKCQNLVAEIIEKRGKELIVAVPQTAGVQVGDYLAVYHREGPAVNFQNRNLGYDLHPAGFVQVLRVMPDFIVAKVSGETKQPISVGDWVKAW